MLQYVPPMVACCADQVGQVDCTAVSIKNTEILTAYMLFAGGVAAMACDASGLLASGSHSGVISLLHTGRHATGNTMRLLAPNHRLSARTSPQTLQAHGTETKYDLEHAS